MSIIMLRIISPAGLFNKCITSLCLLSKRHGEDYCSLHVEWPTFHIETANPDCDLVGAAIHAFYDVIYGSLLQMGGGMLPAG